MGKVIVGHTVVIWFRRDLRLGDHPAVHYAVCAHAAIIPVFIFDPQEGGTWGLGAAGRWWLYQSLQSLDRDLRLRGLRLIIRKGPSLSTLLKLIQEVRASRVYWSRRYEPQANECDKKIEAALRSRSIETKVFNSSLLIDPHQIRNRQGKPYQVFSPFFKQCLIQIKAAHSLPKPGRLHGTARTVKSLMIKDLKLEPKMNWTQGLNAMWTPGEAGAGKSLNRFLRKAIFQYPKERDIPAASGTSRLSPHLHFGEISPHTIWRAVSRKAGTGAYLRQLVWREFAYHLLVHFPRTPANPLREGYRYFPWICNHEAFRAWQKGRTGYPIVDAGMRELWNTGWMHNRVRMIAGSFLVKNLIIHWVKGARWFWDTLVDADLANNTMGWQWVAGCGADAAPYFRIFNPILQGKKFDSEGAYVRRWIPEIAKLPAKWIHRPWQAPAGVLINSGVKLGRDYPWPVVDLEFSRRRALAAYAVMRRRKS